MDKKVEIKDFDDIFDHIGGFGPYQWILFSMSCIINCFFSFLYFGQIFMVLTPPHWCSPPPGLEQDLRLALGANLTEEQLKILTVPKIGQEFSKCSQYEVNIEEIESYEGNFLPNVSWDTTECKYGWNYNFTIYYPSITSQMNWVCEEDWKPPFAQAGFFIGSMIGVPLFGWLGDSFGRVPAIISSNLLAGIFGLASSFSSSFWVFCALRFIVGLAYDSNFLIIYILVLEYVSAPWRSFVSNVPIMVFLTASMCSIPWIAYYLHDWQMFGIALHVPFLLCIFLIWITPESARWLISKGKIPQAVNIVRRAAHFNRKELHKDVMDNFEAYAVKAYEDSDTESKWYHLMKTPNLRKRFLILVVMWIAIFVAYDGHIRQTENIGANIFISFTLMGAVEFPGDLVTIFCIDWFGRKHTTIFSLILAGAASLTTITIAEGSDTILLAVAIMGRFFITMSINVGQQYIMEVLPTVARAQGSGIIHTIGMGTAFASPYIIYLSKYQFWLPYFVYGVISITGGLACLALPETLNEKLPDSLQDGETYFCDQPVFYNPWKKKIKTLYEETARRLSLRSEGRSNEAQLS